MLVCDLGDILDGVDALLGAHHMHGVIACVGDGVEEQLVVAHVGALDAVATLVIQIAEERILSFATELARTRTRCIESALCLSFLLVLVFVVIAAVFVRVEAIAHERAIEGLADAVVRRTRITVHRVLVDNAKDARARTQKRLIVGLARLGHAHVEHVADVRIGVAVVGARRALEARRDLIGH